VVTTGAALQLALNEALAGETVRIADGLMLTGNFVADRPVRIVSNMGGLFSPNVSPALSILGDDVTVDGPHVRSFTGAATNDLIVIRGARTTLRGVSVAGNGQTKRGVQLNGADTLIEQCSVTNICKPGVESQALCGWDGTRITVRDTVLQAASIGFLMGGAATTVPDHVPEEILLERVTISRPPEWRGAGLAVKNCLEIKNGRFVTIRDCQFSDSWTDAQTGFGLVLTPSGGPASIVEFVLVERLRMLNVGSGINLLGTGQNTVTLQSNDIEFTDCDFQISRAAGGGHGSLIQIGRAPRSVRFHNTRVQQDGDAFVRVSDLAPIEDFTMFGCTVDRVGTYGLYAPSGNYRGTGFATLFPGGSIQGNTFDALSAHATFRQNFPNNLYQ
jgi:hypothetical protein